MGSIIRASCECGFEEDSLFIGNGFADLGKDRYLAPAVCLNCSKIVVKNYRKKYPRCSKCGKKVRFYDDITLQAESNESSQFDGEKEEFNLRDTTYLCPKCGKMTMRFFEAGCWD